MSCRWLVANLAFLILGCGRGVPYDHQADVSSSSSPTQTVAFQEAVGSEDTVPVPADMLPTDRKIIHHAELRVEVTELSQAADSVESLVGQHEGFIAASELGGSSGSTRSGRWTLRVPVAQYRSLLTSLAELGELREQRETSEEVTAEFFDLEARVRNKQQEEQRLLSHLEETTRQLPEILKIEQEISRVRGEVERLQGRLKLLADQTSLSTIELTINETKPFVTAEVPAFTTRLQGTLTGSMDRQVEVIQGLTLVMAAVLPWVVMMATVLAVPLSIPQLRRRWLTGRQREHSSG